MNTFHMQKQTCRGRTQIVFATDRERRRKEARRIAKLQKKNK